MKEVVDYKKGEEKGTCFWVAVFVSEKLVTNKNRSNQHLNLNLQSSLSFQIEIQFHSWTLILLLFGTLFYPFPPSLPLNLISPLFNLDQVFHFSFPYSFFVMHSLIFDFLSVNVDMFMDGFDENDFEDEDDDVKEEFLCPFCSQYFDIVGLCCHIDEDHPVEAKNGVSNHSNFFLFNNFLIALFVIYINIVQLELGCLENLNCLLVYRVVLRIQYRP